MPKNKSKMVIYSVFGIGVAAMLTIIGMVGYALLNQTRSRDQESNIKASTTTTTIESPLSQDKPISSQLLLDPVEWTWLKKAEPSKGTLEPSFVATNRPVTWEEVFDFAQEQMAGEYKYGIKFGVFFDEDFGRKVIAAGNLYDNMFFNSNNGMIRTGKPYSGIERSPANLRLVEWENNRLFPEMVWDTSFESGHLICSTTEFGTTLDETGRMKVKSVPEIWWLINVNILDESNPNLISYFYDLDELEVLIFDRKGGRQIATFTVPRKALDEALVQGPLPKGILTALYEELDAIDESFQAAAISKKEHSQLLHEWAIKEMSYFRDWFILMARYGARLEVNESISHEVPYDFLPK